MNRGRLARRLVQVMFLVLFVVLLRAARWSPEHVGPVSVFLRSDPLASLVTVLSGLHWASAGQVLWVVVPGLVVLGLTALFGRFYCGWICPLGTCIDLFGAAVVRPVKRRDSRWGRLPWLKYCLLAAVLFSALLGAQTAWLLDPIPLTTRTFATVFHPALLQVQNWLAMHSSGPAAALSSRLGLQIVVDRGFALAWPVAAVFALVLGLSFISRRYWCRNLCPLGALLGFAGRWGTWRRVVSEDCLHCKRCVTDCKMGAIPEDRPDHTTTSECILCYNCLSCPRPGLSRIGISGDSRGHDRAVAASRRRILGAAGAGLAYGLLARTGLASGRQSDGRYHRLLIRPPGAIVRDSSGHVVRMMTEAELRSQCIRCGLCMKACVTGVLQPAVFEGGLDGFYTPVVNASVGWCEQNCDICGSVCPTGALRPFTVEEKSHIQIARAQIDQHTCLSWQTGDEYQLCLVCSEVCSYHAVANVVTDGSGQLRPVVCPNTCVGCGICEFNCPAGPPDAPSAAIRIYRLDSFDASERGPRRRQRLRLGGNR
jgi:polyferredoxin